MCVRVCLSASLKAWVRKSLLVSLLESLLRSLLRSLFYPDWLRFLLQVQEKQRGLRQRRLLSAELPGAAPQQRGLQPLKRWGLLRKMKREEMILIGDCTAEFTLYEESVELGAV